MSHDSNSPEADREFNELYRAAQGHGGSHAPGNTSLNSIKNNPSRDGLTVKHSDFFVNEVNKTLSVTNNRLERSEETEVTVTFSGARSGFIQEIMVNPNNFEWYVSDESKDLIRISKGVPASHPNKEDWGQSGDTEYGAFKIRIKNIAPCSDQDVTAYIRCKFKDDFNENIGASKGYNTELTGTVTLVKNPITMPMTTVRNQNNYKSNVAYDNEMEYDSNTGQNSGEFDDKNSQDRNLISLLDNNDDLVIRGSLNGGNILNSIYGVDVVWQKYNESNQWVDIVLTENFGYQPAFVEELKSTNNPDGNAGQLLKSFKNGKTSKSSLAQLNVQGTHGGGLYRCRVTVTGDPADPFVCTFISDQIHVYILPRIPKFTLSGQGYGCHGGTTNLTVQPVVATRDTISSGISNINIQYTLYKVLADGLQSTGQKYIKPNDGNTFNIPVTSAGDYTVRALMVPTNITESDDIRPGDTTTGGYGMRYSTPRVDTGYNTSSTSTTLGVWYNNAAYRRLTVPPVETPNIFQFGRMTMSGSGMSWRWEPVANPTGGTVRYQVRVVMKNQTGGWYENTPWTDTPNNGQNTYYTISNAPESVDDNLPNARVELQVRAAVVPPTNQLASGDASLTCYSEVIAKNLINTLTCTQIKSTMPVPELKLVSQAPGNDRPVFELDFDNTSWSPSFDYNPVDEHYVNITTKSTGQSDATYQDVTQQIADLNNLHSSRVLSFGGLNYIKFESSTTRFATNKTFGKGVTFRFRSFTEYSDDVKTCYSDIRTIIGTVIAADAVYTYTPNIDRPINPDAGSHKGNVDVTTSGTFDTFGFDYQSWFMIGSDSTRVNHNTFAFGINADNMTTIKVTGVHEPDNPGTAQSSGVALQQMPSPPIPPRATHPVVNLKIRNGLRRSDTEIENQGNMTALPYNSTSTNNLVYGIGGGTPWVMHEEVVVPGTSPQKKQWQTRKLERIAADASRRSFAEGKMENINKTTRIISRKT